MNRELYLLSNSRMPGGEPFAWAIDYLLKAWDGRVKSAALVPFAGVTLSWDEYLEYVSSVFGPHDIAVSSVHRASNAHQLVNEADAVFVGGGNSFHLTHHLHASGLMPLIRDVCLAGKPYRGWSAGANVACPTMRTTNDMPIIEPASFTTLGLVPFQINPHYNNAMPPNHGGETRDQRIEEFVTANPGVRVIGVPEGNLLHVTGDSMTAFGSRPLRVFESGKEPFDVASEDLSKQDYLR